MTRNEAVPSLAEAVGVVTIAYRHLDLDACWTMLHLQADLLGVPAQDVAAFVELNGRLPSEPKRAPGSGAP